MKLWIPVGVVLAVAVSAAPQYSLLHRRGFQSHDPTANPTSKTSVVNKFKLSIQKTVSALSPIKESKTFAKFSGYETYILKICEERKQNPEQGSSVHPPQYYETALQIYRNEMSPEQRQNIMTIVYLKDHVNVLDDKNLDKKSRRDPVEEYLRSDTHLPRPLKFVVNGQTDTFENLRKQFKAQDPDMYDRINNAPKNNPAFLFSDLVNHALKKLPGHWQVEYKRQYKKEPPGISKVADRTDVGENPPGSIESLAGTDVGGFATVPPKKPVLPQASSDEITPVTPRNG